MVKVLMEMHENEVSETSTSLCASLIALNLKKNASTRSCEDYYRLNDITKKNSYPLPSIDDLLNTLSGHKWFSTMELKNGH